MIEEIIAGVAVAFILAVVGWVFTQLPAAAARLKQDDCAGDITFSFALTASPWHDRPAYFWIWAKLKCRRLMGFR